LTIEDCAFFQNYALRGGGIYAESGSLSITRGEFAENSATSLGGGAIYIRALATTTISDSTFTLNSATDADTGYGGAIYISSWGGPAPRTVTLSGVTLYENWGVRRGGAIYVERAGGTGTTLALIDTSIYDNWLTSNTGEGGGIYFGSGSLVLEDAVILNNTAPHGSNIYLVTGTSIIDLPLYFTNIYTFEEGP
jgi:predicted outer membrane repeat protein